VVSLLQERKHHVLGLARSDAKAEQLLAQGIEPVRGDLTTLQQLEEAARAADGVVHTAFTYDAGIDFDTAVEMDKKAISALAAGLAGTGKPLIVTSGIGVLGDTGDILADEEFPAAAQTRVTAEREALLKAAHGVRVVVLRLPLYVYGHGGSAFIPAQLEQARQLGKVYYMEPASNKVSVVHVDDAARAYVAAVETPDAHGVFNIAGEHGITAEAIGQALAKNLGLPAPQGLNQEQAEDVKWLPMWIRVLLSTNNQASSAKAKRVLGWEPTPSANMLHDIAHGSYKQ
jgi:nucleoside-diphosphate-sugar epimerase